MGHRPLTVQGPDLNHEFTTLLSIALLYQEILKIYIFDVFCFSFVVLKSNHS